MDNGVVTLFAGAGGADLGMEDVGLEHLALVEWDADACATLRAARPEWPVIEADLRRLNLRDKFARLWGRMGRRHRVPPGLRHLRGARFLWSSFPCQCWSLAGKRLGARDPRNGWPWTRDAIDTVRPTWFKAENVMGLLQHSSKTCGDPMLCPGCYTEQVILPDLQARFAWVDVWRLDAADYGVPQHRRRVFFVGGPHPVAPPEATHGDPAEVNGAQAGLFGDGREPWVSMGVALGLCGVAESDSKQRVDDAGVPRGPLLRDMQAEPAFPVCSRAPDVRIIGGGTNPRAPGEGHTRTYRDLTDEPSTTIAAEQIGNAGPWVLEHGRNSDNNPTQERPTPATEPAPAPAIGGKGNQYLSQPSPCVTTTEVKGTRGEHMNKSLRSGGKSGGVDRASDALWLATGRRRLTVAECAILQDFPPGWPFQGTKSAQYRQVGNAVPRRLAAAVAGAVVAADAGLSRESA